jgi:hypothetical protein
MTFVDLREFIAPTQGELPDGEVDIITDIDLAPFDESDGSEDQDNSLLQNSELGFLALPTSVSAEETRLSNSVVKRKIIPFHRILKRGSVGKDVIAVKRALVRANCRSEAMRNDPHFGKILKNNLKEFQQRHQLKVDGQYGPKTHAKLVRYFDGYSEWLYLHSPKKPSVSSTRQHIAATAIYGYNHRWNMYYTMGPLRMQGVNRHMQPPQYPTWADCSAYATWCYWVAGAPDPNGRRFNYNGQGYTGTQVVNGMRVFVPQVGDLAFYGHGWPYTHVTICIGNGRCISMGSSAGPLLLPVLYRPDFSQYRSYL